MSNNFSEHGEKIKKIRGLINKTGWTLEKLSVESGVKSNRIYKLLNTKANVKDGELEKLIDSMESVFKE